MCDYRRKAVAAGSRPQQRARVAPLSWSAQPRQRLLRGGLKQSSSTGSPQPLHLALRLLPIASQPPALEAPPWGFEQSLAAVKHNDGVHSLHCASTRSCIGSGRMRSCPKWLPQLPRHKALLLREASSDRR